MTWWRPSSPGPYPELLVGLRQARRGLEHVCQGGAQLGQLGRVQELREDQISLVLVERSLLGGRPGCGAADLRHRASGRLTVGGGSHRTATS